MANNFPQYTWPIVFMPIVVKDVVDNPSLFDSRANGIEQVQVSSVSLFKVLANYSKVD